MLRPAVAGTVFAQGAATLLLRRQPRRSRLPPPPTDGRTTSSLSEGRPRRAMVDAVSVKDETASSRERVESDGSYTAVAGRWRRISLQHAAVSRRYEATTECRRGEPATSGRPRAELNAGALARRRRRRRRLDCVARRPVALVRQRSAVARQHAPALALGAVARAGRDRGRRRRGRVARIALPAAGSARTVALDRRPSLRSACRAIELRCTGDRMRRSRGDTVSCIRSADQSDLFGMSTGAPRSGRAGRSASWRAKPGMIADRRALACTSGRDMHTAMTRRAAEVRRAKGKRGWPGTRASAARDCSAISSAWRHARFRAPRHHAPASRPAPSSRTSARSSDRGR